MSDEARLGSRWSRRAAEGATIVASILLALAADSAWSYRGDRVEERRLLEGLRGEFAEAATEVESDLAARAEMLRRIELIAVGNGLGQPPIDSLPVIVSALLDWRFYTPAHAVLDDAMTSGRLDLIRSDDVRRSIMGYVQQRGRIPVFDERERDFVADRMEPVLIEGVALAEILDDRVGGVSPAEAARFWALAAEPEFGSLVELRKQRTEEATVFSRLVRGTIEEVSTALDRELNTP